MRDIPALIWGYTYLRSVRLYPLDIVMPDLHFLVDFRDVEMLVVYYHGTLGHVHL